jgi:hypothetical protein
VNNREMEAPLRELDSIRSPGKSIWLSTPICRKEARRISRADLVNLILEFSDHGLGCQCDQVAKMIYSALLLLNLPPFLYEEA